MKAAGHIIDNVLRLKDKSPYQMRRGSVLMEFIIVFPIYLVLVGGVFAIGDMLLCALRLASSERTAAFDVPQSYSGWNAVKTLLFPSPYNDGLPGSPSSSEYYSDINVRGPWTLRAATKIQYSYKAPSWTRGWLAFPDAFFHDAVHAVILDGPIEDIIQKKRVSVYSKSLQKNMKYNYYTLKRRKWTPPRRTWRWRGRPPSDLVWPIWNESPWYTEVYGEQWHETILDGSNSPKSTPPVGILERYVRNIHLEEWSRY